MTFSHLTNAILLYHYIHIFHYYYNFSYGERNNLTFALPKQPAAHVFNYNIKFNPSMVRPSPTGQYNILCNHLHFNERGVQDVMPMDTKYIAIVRHPGTCIYLQNH